MAGLYVIGRRLFNRETGLIAALFYSIFQPWAVPKNLAFNGEVLMNLPLVWAWAIAFGPSNSRLRPELFLAGALLCAGFLLKQPAAIAAPALAIYLLLPSYRASRGATKTGSVIQAAILTAGFFAVLALVAIVLQRQGILRDAFYWTFTNHTVPYIFWQVGILHTLGFVSACFPLVAGAAMAFRDRDSVWSKRNAERTALLGLLAASAIGTAAGARFYPHYYIQLVPPLALLAAPYYAQLWSGRIKPRHWFLRPALSYAWLALAVVGFSISHWVFLAPERESSQTARYLIEHARPDDRLFVWGPSAAKFYLQTRLRPATRYVFTFPLTGFVFGPDLPGLNTQDRIVPGAWHNLEEDFRRHPPAYIADHEAAPDAQYPVRNFPILAQLLAQHYQPVARTEQGIIYRLR
jgi:4-amino-4-deoxy-L-arabinose transferase-like glycosyltransferase